MRSLPAKQSNSKTVAPALRSRAQLRFGLNGLAVIAARLPVALNAAAQTEGFGMPLGSSPGTLAQFHEDAEGVCRVPPTTPRHGSNRRQRTIKQYGNRPS